MLYLGPKPNTTNRIATKDEISGASGAVVSQTEVDFGSTPVPDGTFTITDGSATASSKVIAQLAYDAPTGKDLDEVEMDDLEIRCGQAASGSFKMFIKATDGSYLHDKFKINYTIYQ